MPVRSSSSSIPGSTTTIAQGHIYTLDVPRVCPLSHPGSSSDGDQITIRGLAGIALAFGLAFGSDYHFGLVDTLGSWVSRSLYLIIRRNARRALRIAIAVGAGLGLLSVYSVDRVCLEPGVIQSNNSPASVRPGLFLQIHVLAGSLLPGASGDECLGSGSGSPWPPLFPHLAPRLRHGCSPSPSP